MQPKIYGIQELGLQLVQFRVAETRSATGCRVSLLLPKPIEERRGLQANPDQARLGKAGVRAPFCEPRIKESKMLWIS